MRSLYQFRDEEPHASGVFWIISVTSPLTHVPYAVPDALLVFTLCKTTIFAFSLYDLLQL